MRVLGLCLKALAGLIVAFALIGLGYDIENGHLGGDSLNAVVFLVLIAWLVLKAGERWHESVSILEFDVADRPAARRYRPTRHSGWLPPEVWRQLPDPIPGVPDVTGDPDTDIPHSNVPPDQTLRRLWLVRAQLAVHLDQRTIKARMRYPEADALAVASLGVAGAVTLALFGSQEPPGDRFLLGSLLACGFLLWPFSRSLLAATAAFGLVAKRRHALQEAEIRLMALDAQRDGGPLGGPAVQPGQLPYVPPSVPSWRLP